MNTSIVSSSVLIGQDLNQLVYLSIDRLKLHPHNMRRYYSPQDVAKMAGSIQATGGVYQALLIVADPAESGTYFVVDGNMRLAAGRTLGDNCPLFKCELIPSDHAQQLLAMTITSEFHFPKDPVSQGLHYRRLIEQEKLTIVDIAQATGVSRPTIEKALKTLELEPDIQQLLIEKRLSPDLRVTRALLDLPDSATRLRLARRFAQHETSIKGILQSCRFVIRQAAQLTGQTALERLEAAETKKQQVAAKARQAKIKITDPARLPPDAAHLILSTAQKTLCADCALDGLGQQCYLCPGPRDFINAVLELTDAVAEPPAHPQGNGHLTTEKARLLSLGATLRANLTDRRAA